MKNTKALVKNLAYGGNFAAHITEATNPEIINKTIFIPNALPGEEVEVEITKDKKNFAEGKLLKIIKESEHRKEAPCEYFNECGGCQIQHTNIEYQRELKDELLSSTYKKIIGEELDLDIENLSKEIPEFNYRNKIQLHFKDNTTGFFKEATNDIINIDSCLIASKTINTALASIKGLTLPKEIIGIDIEDLPSKETLLIVKLRQKKLSPNFCEKIASIFKEYKNVLILNNKRHAYSSNENIKNYGNFSQVNNVGNNILNKVVLEHITETNVTELYAGSGNFTFNYDRKAKDIHAVELDNKLVKRAKRKIKNKKISNIKFFTSKAEDFTKTNPIFETLLLDPPREGALKALENANLDNTKKIIYVSCNMATFCRDIKLLNLKGFKLKKLHSLDMFPQTAHLEAIGILTKE